MERPAERRRRLSIQAVVRAAKHDPHARDAGAFALARLADGQYRVIVGDDAPSADAVIIARFVRRGLRWKRIHEEMHDHVNCE